jgi:hypothetical protein
MTHSTSKPTSTAVSQLFQTAEGAGVLSAASASLLTGHLGAVVVAGAAGVAAEDIRASDVTLVTVLIDMSSSISQRGLTQAVREGQNMLLGAFADSREADAILVALWTFNDDQKVVHGYVPVKDATRLDGKSYRPGGSTVLYDAWCDALAANVAYAEQLKSSGTPVKSVIVVITDGEDTGSTRRPPDCARLSRDLLASEQFILAFVGVGSEVDFRKVAQSMGVPDGSIAVQEDATPSALRQAFQMVSRSAIRASQGLIRPGAGQSFFGP